MAVTNNDRITRMMELLQLGLKPFVERELTSHFGKYWITEVSKNWKNELSWQDDDTPHLDSAVLLRLMWEQWNDVFKKTLGFNERSWVSELRGVRNKWAHQERFSSDDTYRALDTAERLLAAMGAPQSEELERMKLALLRQRFDEQARTGTRTIGGALETPVTGVLKPWREVVTPHVDVAGGRYQQAEFAADLWQVHLGEGSDEYRNPVEFFRRTYLTASLTQLLVGAIQRLSGNGGDPVVQLQTNFGGGKTHSMLALYHLFGGARPAELSGIDAVIQAAGGNHLPAARRVVLVGNKISPGNPRLKADGTLVRTLWGEMAWQLGGRAAYERVRLDDERATNPGDALRTLFKEYGPALILIDEWVAYARQLHDVSDLPAGSFETQFSFAQALTESAKLAGNCLLVISLPASDTAGASHTQADDVEVGGQRGREALERLRNVIGRVESSWRPASAEEGFEIVRRRLFEPLNSKEQYSDRDVVARAFADLYRTQKQEFPVESSESGYEQRIRAAYPIHPEVFDRLYSDWSTLVKFQRTRGVLRLMAAVIHSLWQKNDRNPLIMPANIPIDEPRVQFELTRYLSDNWVPILEKDVDGPGSLPMRIDSDVPNLGKFAAARRVARTVYLGSAPVSSAANRGMEDRRIKLGCVMPGEAPALFGDALRRLAAAATYLYQDGSRYWYSTQPTVTKLAEDRAEQFKREPDRIQSELDKRLRVDLRKTGDFSRIHPLPTSSADVPDDLDTRLVVLRIEYAYSKEAGNAAEAAARAILENRGNAPRIYRNTLVFLAADKARVSDLEDALRRYLAWESILDEKDTLDLSPYQVKQAEMQRSNAESMVTARIPETYQILLTPTQSTPQAAVSWQADRLSGQDGLAVRASKKLRNQEGLILVLAGTTLRRELDRVPLWRGDHVTVRQLIEDFARYHYLPRLRDGQVLREAVQSGINLLTWENDTFAYAEGYDESKERYLGLRAGQLVSVSDSSGTLIVRPEAARRQMDAELAPIKPIGPPVVPPIIDGDSEKPVLPPPPPPPPPARKLRRFHGSVVLDAARVGRDATRISEEIINHMRGLAGANVRITLEIEADVEDGVPQEVVRIVTENSRVLKFTQIGFEEE
jgi:predicted AAA+ superfamily ATPase